MKISGWRRPNDAKALNHTERENPTTVFNLLDCALHNGSKCVSKKMCLLLFTCTSCSGCSARWLGC